MQQRILIQTDSLKNSKSVFSWNDFFSFRRMITSQVIQVVYFLVAGLITLGGIVAMFFDNSLPDFVPGGFVTGIIILVFGNILWRICCEIIIVLFRISKTLSDIDKHTKTEHL